MRPLFLSRRDPPTAADMLAELPPEFAAAVTAKRLFDPESVKAAALDIWIRDRVAPQGWPYQQRVHVIRELRAGKSPRAISRATHLDIAQIKRIQRVVNASDVASAMKDNPDLAALRDTTGIAAVEFAFVAPVMITLILGGLNLGMALFSYQRLAYAAESAATCGGTGQCSDSGAVIAYASERAGMAGATFTSASEPCGVHVAGEYTFGLIKMFPDIPISVNACFPKLPTGGGA